MTTKNQSQDRTCRKAGPGLRAAMFLGFAAVIALGCGPALAKTQKKPSGYIAFAKLSNSEKVLGENVCREYGGRPVGGDEQNQVMRAARTDKWFYNVIWFGQHQYVTYKRDTSETITGKIGLHPYSVSLCQF
jgi:hypothetical protein